MEKSGVCAFFTVHKKSPSDNHYMSGGGSIFILEN